jgi:hypothetical protein
LSPDSVFFFSITFFAGAGCGCSAPPSAQISRLLKPTRCSNYLPSNLPLVGQGGNTPADKINKNNS